MIRDGFITHFRNLCSASFADGWMQLARAEQELEQGADAMLDGPFYRRLAKLYVAQISALGRVILTKMQQAHADFKFPLDGDVDDIMVSLAGDMFRKEVEGVREAFQRKVEGFGYPMSEGMLEAARSDLQDAADYAGVVTEYGGTCGTFVMCRANYLLRHLHHRHLSRFTDLSTAPS